MICIMIDLMMMILMFLFGMYFYKSNGKAANILAGYNMKSMEDREKFDEVQMCKNYGKIMMYMAIPFSLGAVIDIRFNGIGCLTAWGLWLILFITLLIKRHKIEKNIS